MGFTALFDGKDLKGWKGLVADPPHRAKMTPEELAAAREKGRRAEAFKHWKARKRRNRLRRQKQQSLHRERLWRLRDAGGLEDRAEAATAASICAAARRCRYGTRSTIPAGRRRLRRPVQQPEESQRSDANGRQTHRRMEPLPHPDGRRQSDGLPEQSNLSFTTSRWKTTGSATSRSIPTGQIELQHHGDSLYFKNIYIREIKTAPSDGGRQTVPGSEDRNLSNTGCAHRPRRRRDADVHGHRRLHAGLGRLTRSVSMPPCCATTNLLRQAIALHDGYEVKPSATPLWWRFRRPLAAALCALEISG